MKILFDETDTLEDIRKGKEFLDSLENKETNQKQLTTNRPEVCNKCGKTIVDEDGHTTKDIIKYSKYKYKKIICPKCQKEEG